MTLLEAISPTARELLAHGITKGEGCKVHAIREDGHPLCGGGNGGAQITHWMRDWVGVNCAACLAIIKRRDS